MTDATPPAAVSPEDGGTAFAITLMEHLVVPTFVLDAELRVLIWNRACEHLTGVPASEVIGTREHWRAFYESPRPCLADLVAEGAKGRIEQLYVRPEALREPGQGLRAETWCHMPRRGQSLYLAVDAGPIFDAGGRLIAVVETLRDMSDRKRAEDQLQQLASRDLLTGLGNRHAFDAALELEWRSGERDETSLALLLIDIDHFKRFNDRYGHAAGDECLKRVAATINRFARRAGDLAVRYGSEAFVLLLPDFTRTQAQAVAQRVCDAVRSLRFVDDDEIIGVTVSIGLAVCVPMPGIEATLMLQAADAALDEAKQAGRDRVRIGEV